MALTAIGRAALVAREALKTRAYRDSVGVWTIGVGHTSMAGLPKVTAGLTITEAEALEIFSRDLVKYEATVDQAVKVPLADHERDALVSICFNIGQGAFAKSTFVKRLNAGDRAGCAEAIMSWKKPAAIISRRTGERDQFLIPYSTSLPKARSNDRAPIRTDGSVPPRSTRMPTSKPEWAEDSLATFEIEAVQKRLRDLGFWQVGKVDGKWGPSTKGALIALQATAGITQDGHWGPETKAALANDKNRRKVDPQRANTTASDLRQQGSVIAVQGFRVTWASVLGLIMALIGAAHAAYTAPADLPFGSSLLLGLIPPPFGSIVSAAMPYLIAFLPLAYSAFAAQGIVKARVVAEQTGLHNGEPDPAPSPPLTVPSDTPKPGGLFGSLFGAR